jgi:hypothetical protein
VTFANVSPWALFQLVPKGIAKLMILANMCQKFSKNNCIHVRSADTNCTVTLVGTDMLNPMASQNFAKKFAERLPTKY